MLSNVQSCYLFAVDSLTAFNNNDPANFPGEAKYTVAFRGVNFLVSISSDKIGSMPDVIRLQERYYPGHA